MTAATTAAASTYGASYDAANGVVLHIPTKEQVLLMFYHELPSRAAATAAVALFAAATVALLASTCKTRAWFMLAAVLTGAMEVAGYALRLRMMAEPEFFTYVVSYALLILAPVFLALVEYVAVSKIIQRSPGASKPSRCSSSASGCSGRHRVHEVTGSKANGLPTAADTMPPQLQQGAAAAVGASSSNAAVVQTSAFARCVSWFLVISEVACLGLQCAAGGPLTSKDEATREVGRRMMLAGLLLQLAFFTMFTFIVLAVHLAPRFGYRGARQFGWVFGVLYSSIALIYLRNVFRVVEFVQGFNGYLATHESYFYGFDCAVVLAIMLLFAVFNYGYALSGSSNAGSALPHGGAAAAAAAQQMPVAEVVPRALPRRRPRMTLAMAVGVKEAVKAAMQSRQAAAAAAAGDGGSSASADHQLPR